MGDLDIKKWSLAWWVKIKLCISHHIICAMTKSKHNECFKLPQLSEKLVWHVISIVGTNSSGEPPKGNSGSNRCCKGPFYILDWKVWLLTTFSLFNIFVHLNDVFFMLIWFICSGSVYSCGGNEWHQLGITPPPALSMLPKQVCAYKIAECVAICNDWFKAEIVILLNLCHSCILNSTLFYHFVFQKISSKGSKGKKFIGVCAQRFHSVVYTADSVLTCGLNAGQLGKRTKSVLVCVQCLKEIFLKDWSTIICVILFYFSKSCIVFVIQVTKRYPVVVERVVFLLLDLLLCSIILTSLSSV